MRAMPYQTYLAERLQSAKGLGWDFEKTGVGVGWTKPSMLSIASVCWARFALPNLRRLIKQHKIKLK
jgi:hypothetical protein